MRRHFLAVSAACGLILWALPVSAAEVLRLGGTGGATALLTYLGKPFTAETGIAVEVVPGLGSGGGINATIGGALDITVSGRPLSATERERGLIEATMVRTPYVLATSRTTPTSMTEQEVLAAFTKDKANWPDGTTIKLILRPRPESDNLTLVALFPGMAAALEAARGRPELPITATDQDNADIAEMLPGSLMGTTYAQIVMEARHLYPIAINGVVPSMEAFANGTYPHAKLFRIIHQRQHSAAVQRFIEFLHTEKGVEALRAGGCLSGIE